MIDNYYNFNRATQVERLVFRSFNWRSIAHSDATNTSLVFKRYVVASLQEN